MSVFLVGGGPDTTRTAGLLDPFVAEVRSHAEHRGRDPRVAVVLVDDGASGERFLPEYVDVLGARGSVETVRAFIHPDRPLGPEAFAEVDGIVVGGGPTPAYLDGLVPAFDIIRSAVAGGVPYLGFSAGAMVAARRAVVGGHRVGDHEVCPEEWSEGLSQVTVTAGLALVDFTVDVHTAQAGTLGRTIAVLAMAGVEAVGIDEDTCVAVPETGSGAARDLVVTGSGCAWVVRRDASGSAVVTQSRGRVPTPSV